MIMIINQDNQVWLRWIYRGVTTLIINLVKGVITMRPKPFPAMWWVIIIIIGLCVIFFMIVPLVELIKGVDFFPKKDESLITFHYICLIMLSFFLVVMTGILAYVADRQLEAISKAAKADFLMRIDDRYASDAILKARHTIQRLYRESNNLHPEAPESVHRSHIAIKINEISEDINSSEEYTYLLNLLDFLETISYFTNKGDISESDIQNLMGPSMEFFFTIFTPRIEHRRRKYGNEAYYCELQTLVEKMLKKKST